MCAEGDEVVASGRLSADLVLQKLKHQRHGHGASAIGNDGQHTLAREIESAGRLGNDLADLIAGQHSINRALTDGHWFRPWCLFSVLRFACALSNRNKTCVSSCYWSTPLARNPPSTGSTWPVTKLAASEARNTTAPPSSSSFPNLFIGVRSRNSRPRSVPSSRVAFRSVRKTPGAIAFTQTPDLAHSIARDFVSEATAALLAL